MSGSQKIRWDRAHRSGSETREVVDVRTKVEPEISQSALSISLGQRLQKRAGPMPNIKGDRPPEPDAL